MSEDLMTPEEVAAFLRVEKRWVYDAARRELLPSTKVGKFLRFHRTDVEQYVAVGSREESA